MLLSDEKRCFCAVANDLGGTAAGELASRIFSKTAVQVFQPANDSANH
jgi:serine/threonine protein phosphatase PrpC